MNEKERLRRWRLAIGEDASQLSEEDQRLSAALGALYEPASQRKGKGGLGAAAPRVSRWLGDIREFFPTPVVQVIQKDALERLNLKSLMLEPEFLSTLEADVHLVADLISLRSAIPEKTKKTTHKDKHKVVNDLLARLEHKTVEI